MICSRVDKERVLECNRGGPDVGGPLKTIRSSWNGDETIVKGDPRGLVLVVDHDQPNLIEG